MGLRRLLFALLLALVAWFGWRLMEHMERTGRLAPDDAGSAADEEGWRKVGPALPPTAPTPGGPPSEAAPSPVPVVERFLLRGRVVEAGTDGPASGAVVRVRAERGTTFDSVVCDADGRFELERAEARVNVFVLGGGWVTDRLAEARDGGFNPLPVLLASDHVIERVFHAVRSAVVSGRVLGEDDWPMPYAGVYVVAKRRHYDSFPWWPAFLSRACAVRADARGRFTIDTLVPGLTHQLGAWSQKRGVGLTREFLAEAGHTYELDVRLPRSRWARVRVVEEGTQKGVPELEVTLATARPFGEQAAMEASTDADGWARLGPLARGWVSLSAGSGAWILAGAAPIFRDPESEEDIEAVLEVRRAYAITGRVLRRDGSPAADVWLDASREGKSATAQTDDEGRFRVAGLTTGTYALKVLDSFMGTAILETSVEAGATELELRLTESLRRETEVIVLGPDGEPVPLCDYQVAQAGGSMSAERAPTPLSLLLARQPRWLEVSAARAADGTLLGYAAASLGPIAPDAQTVTIRMAEGADIRGRVLGPGGAGIAGVNLSAFPFDRGPGTGKLRGFHASVRSDESGAFRLRGLRKATTYSLFVGAGDRWAPVERRDVESGAQEVVVRLTRAIAVDLRVLDRDGRPVEAAIVQVSRRGTGGGIAYGATDSQGVFRANGLSGTDAYALEITPPESRPALGRLLRDGWSPSEREFRLPAADIVRGTVVGADGGPVAGASVYARDASGRDRLVTAGAAGKFALGQLLPGEVLLIAESGGAESGGAESGGKALRRTPAQRVSTSDEAVRLVLRTTREIPVVLESWVPSTADVHMILRTAERGLGSYPYGQIDENGRGVIRKVDPSRTYALHVVVETADGVLVAWAPEVKGNAEQLRLPLRRAKVIRGRLIAPAGARPAYVCVRERGIDVKASVGAEGRFVLEKLPEGTFQLVGVSRGADGRHEVKRMVAAGTEIELR